MPKHGIHNVTHQIEGIPVIVRNASNSFTHWTTAGRWDPLVPCGMSQIHVEELENFDFDQNKTYESSSSILEQWLCHKVTAVVHLRSKSRYGMSKKQKDTEPMKGTSCSTGESVTRITADI